MALMSTSPLEAEVRDRGGGGPGVGVGMDSLSVTASVRVLKRWLGGALYMGGGALHEVEEAPKVSDLDPGLPLAFWTQLQQMPHLMLQLSLPPEYQPVQVG